MQTMRESWTDERLDDLNDKVDRGFERVDKRFEQVDKRFDQVDRRFEQIERRFERVDAEFLTVRGEMKAGFDAVNGRIDSVQRTMFHGVIAITVAILAGFAAITGLLATQL
jgi:chromosome segregation ATPase